MAELWVGPGESFSTLSSAVGASQGGDTIFIRAGVYANDFATIDHPLSIIGVDGMAHLAASTQIGNGKGILITNADTIIENMEFSGAAVAHRNGAGIRQQSGDLTVRNSYFHNNEMGILSAHDSTSQIVIENSTFDRNGDPTSPTHNHQLYIGRVESLTVTDSTFTEADVTHIQSRAFSTTVANSTFDDTEGTASYLINLPNAGEGVITGNTLIYSETAGNLVAINYGTASLKHPGTLTVEDNILINNLDPSKVVSGVRNATDHEAFVTDNILVRFDNVVIGNATQSGNQMLEAEISGDSGANVLTGTAADELIDGRAGDDTISGGGGNDFLIGGAGDDTFVIGAENGDDTILGFVAGAGTEDHFDLSARSDVTNFASLLGVTSDDGTDTTIAFANGDRLTLANILGAELHADDFIFDDTAPPPMSEPPPPVSGGELLSETFGDGNLSGWTVMDQGDVGASSWVVTRNQEVVQKGNIHNKEGNTGIGREGTLLVWNDASAESWQDYTVEATMRSTDNDGIGLAFYFQDADNHYKVDFDQERSFSRLFQVKDGVETTLATTAGPGYVIGEETQLSVSVSGDGITVSRDGEDVFGGPVTGGSLTGGTVALYSWGNVGAYFDDVVVTSNEIPTSTELNVVGQFSVNSEGIVEMAASDLSSASAESTVNTANAEVTPLAATTADAGEHEVPGGDGYSAYDTGSPRDAAFANAVAESA